MGVLLALAGAAAFSVMNVCVRKGVRPGDPDNGVLTTLLINVALYAVVLAVWSLAGSERIVHPAGVAWFVAAGAAATFIGRHTLFGAIRRIGAARGAAIKNATPLVTLTIAVIFLGERLSAVAAGGVAFIAAGLILLALESLGHDAGAGPAAAEPGPVVEAFESEARVEAGFWDRTRTAAAAMGRASRRPVMVGIGLGAAAALAFGSGHAFRKVGMDIMPDALLGASIGAATGLVTHLATSAARGQVASELRTSLRSNRPWFWAAGLAGTLGQFCFFAALAFAPVSHVSMVAGSETVITVVLASLAAGRVEAITARVVVPALLVFGGAALIGLSG